MKAIRFIVLLLMVIGSLNWGLVGFFRYDLVSAIFGEMSMATRMIFAFVGLAGLYGIGFLCRCCHHCSGSGCGSGCKCGPNCKCKKE